MGLAKDDAVPEGMSLRDAYAKIRRWYQQNPSGTASRDAQAASAALIKQLPTPVSASELEIRAVLGEVLSGLLEWGYHESDGEYKMAVYAFAGLKSADVARSLSDAEWSELRQGSKLWHVLTPGARSRRPDEPSYSKTEKFALPPGWEVDAVDIQPFATEVQPTVKRVSAGMLREFFSSAMPVGRLGGIELMVSMNLERLGYGGVEDTGHAMILSPACFHLELATGAGTLCSCVLTDEVVVRELVLGVGDDYGSTVR